MHESNSKCTNPSVESAFLDAMHAAGLDYQGSIVPDGHLHRIKVNGDRNSNGWYVLHPDGIAAGMFGCWKRGTRETWCAKPSEQLTEEERAERDRRWKQQAEARDAERRRQQDKASIEAKTLLDAAQPATDDHPYLQRKHVHAYPGVLVGSWPKRQIDNALLVPLRTAAGKLSSVEAIFPNKIKIRGEERDKDFLQGGAKAGAFFVIGDLEASPFITICEGYATAATVHEATGYAAVMACDAGNLGNVTNALKALYPCPKVLMVCGDNDRKTDANPGKKAALAVSKKSKVRVCLPEFADEEEGSDFNDLAALHGLDRVWNDIESALTGPWTPGKLDAKPVTAFHDRVDIPLKMKNGEVATTYQNAARLLQSAPFSKSIAFNKFAGRLQRIAPVPWNDSPGDWADIDTSRLMLWAAEHHNVDFTADTMERAISVIADDHAFNPAQDRLKALAAQWDGVERLATWLAEYLNAELTPTNREYLAEIGAAWLKGVAARVLKPGCKRDDVLVQVGPQGYRKSTAAAAIANCISPNSFTDSLGNLGSDEAAIGVIGTTVAEFSELSAIARSELEAVKAFVSRSSDRFREKYARHPTDHPRTCSFIATTNEDCGFLRDPSGNRRWWPINITAPIDIPRLESALPQLLGEAARRVIEGEPWYVTDAVALTQADEIREDNSERDVWEAAVLAAMDLLLPHERTIAKVLDHIGVKVERQDRQAQNRVSGILRSNGWERKRGRIGGGCRGYVWSMSLSPKDGGHKGDTSLASQQAGCPTVPICPPHIKNNYLEDETGGVTANSAAESAVKSAGDLHKEFEGDKGDKGDTPPTPPDISRDIPTAPSGVQVLPTGEMIEDPAPGSRVDLRSRGNRLLEQARVMRLGIGLLDIHHSGSGRDGTVGTVKPESPIGKPPKGTFPHNPPNPPNHPKRQPFTPVEADFIDEGEI